MTLYSDNIKNKRESDKAKRALDEFGQWLYYLAQSYEPTNPQHATVNLIHYTFKGYREKYDV